MVVRFLFARANSQCASEPFMLLVYRNSPNHFRSFVYALHRMTKLHAQVHEILKTRDTSQQTWQWHREIGLCFLAYFCCDVCCPCCLPSYLIWALSKHARSSHHICKGESTNVGVGRRACRKWIGIITGCERVLALSLALDAPETRILAPVRVSASVQWLEPLTNVGDGDK